MIQSWGETRGPIEAQDWAVEIDPDTGDLRVTRNGAVTLHLVLTMSDLQVLSSAAATALARRAREAATR